MVEGRKNVLRMDDGREVEDGEEERKKEGGR